MLNFNFILFRNGNITKIFILGLDIILSAFSFYVASVLRHNFDLLQATPVFSLTILSVIAIRLFTFVIFRSYSGIVRFTGEEDLKKMLKIILAGTSCFFVISLLRLKKYGLDFPFSVIIIDFFLLGFLIFNVRIGMRTLHNFLTRKGNDVNNAIMFGAGASANITLQLINKSKSSGLKIVAIFDDNPNIHNKYLDGIKIYNPNVDFKEVVERFKPKKAILSIQNLSPKRKQEFVDLALLQNLTVLQVPPSQMWINGSLHLSQIKEVKVEDLLSRPTIVLGGEHIAKEVKGKVILITGAAGSIGSEIVRQLCSFQPKQLILLDAAESPMAELTLSLQNEIKFDSFVPIVGNVIEFASMEKLFSNYHPEVVFHAAAYKHVPVMESFPREAVSVNIRGTKIIADLAVRFGVHKFVMISTDKAVNPTNVMGASKRIAEIYIQSLNKVGSHTQFITTRFGNVLGSNGSVIPIFRKQLETSRKITVTHPDISRYFMTIPEACQLVLEAAVMGKGGEIFIFDMGQLVKILDLAENMIKLAGLRPYIDIDIEFSGLRPGEKLIEELLNHTENVLPTHHTKIMIAKMAGYDFAKLHEKIEQLISSLDNHNSMELVSQMKVIVPEFISNNSIFSELDEKISHNNSKSKSSVPLLSSVTDKGSSY